MTEIIVQKQEQPILDKPGVVDEVLGKSRVDEASFLTKKFFKNHVCTNSKNKSNFIFEKIPVSQTAFYDLGFDPDFSLDGNFFYKEQRSERPAFRFLLLLIKMIRSIAKYTSFLQTPEEKEFRKLIQIEKEWQKSAQAKGMLYPADLDDFNKAFWQFKAPSICELKEHQFLKQLSKITNINEPNKNTYPSELLKPLHRFNRPQSPSSQSKEDVLNKGAKNLDVARLDTWGFRLLGNHTEYSIDHKSFLHSIDAAGDKLKHTIRELRKALRKGNYEGFNEKLHRFEKHWNEYITSHDLLKNLASVYSQEDFFEAKYQALEEVYQEMQNANVYDDDNFLNDLNDKISKINDQEECSAQLYKALETKKSES